MELLPIPDINISTPKNITYHFKISPFSWEESILSNYFRIMSKKTI